MDPHVLLVVMWVVICSPRHVGPHVDPHVVLVICGSSYGSSCTPRRHVGRHMDPHVVLVVMWALIWILM
jgi:hypothetical protein